MVAIQFSHTQQRYWPNKLGIALEIRLDRNVHVLTQPHMNMYIYIEPTGQKESTYHQSSLLLRTSSTI